jgi:hypothetical protein
MTNLQGELLMKKLILEFLNAKHKRAWCMNEQMLNAWVQMAEDHFENGEGCFIEVKSYESNDGKTHILNLNL